MVRRGSKPALQVYADAQYRAWLQGLSRQLGLSGPDLFDRALESFLAAHGLGPAPPRKLRRAEPPRRRPVGRAATPTMAAAEGP